MNTVYGSRLCNGYMYHGYNGYKIWFEYDGTQPDLFAPKMDKTTLLDILKTHNIRYKEFPRG